MPDNLLAPAPPPPLESAAAPPLPYIVEPAKPVPGFWQAVLLLAIFFAFQILAALILIALAPKGTNPMDAMKSERSLWGLAFANIVAFGVAIWIGKAWSGESWRDRFPLGRVPSALAGPFITTTFGMLITAGAVAIASIAIVTNSPFKDLASPSKLPQGGLVATLFLLSVVAPVTEEFFFRGLVMGGFLRRYTQRKALLVSSALFGVMHMTPLQILPTFMIGMLLGWWRIRTGGILLPVLGHAIHNGFLGMLFVAGTSAGQTSSGQPKLQLLPALGGASVALILGATILIGGMNRAREVFAQDEPAAPTPPPLEGNLPENG